MGALRSSVFIGVRFGRCARPERRGPEVPRFGSPFVEGREGAGCEFVPVHERRLMMVAPYLGAMDLQRRPPRSWDGAGAVMAW